MFNTYSLERNIKFSILQRSYQYTSDLPGFFLLFKYLSLLAKLNLILKDARFCRQLTKNIIRDIITSFLRVRKISNLGGGKLESLLSFYDFRYEFGCFVFNFRVFKVINKVDNLKEDIIVE